MGVEGVFFEDDMVLDAKVADIVVQIHGFGENVYSDKFVLAIDGKGGFFTGVFSDGLVDIFFYEFLVLQTFKVGLDTVDVVHLALSDDDVADGKGVFVHDVEAVFEVGIPLLGDLYKLLEEGVFGDCMWLGDDDIISVRK